MNVMTTRPRVARHAIAAGLAALLVFASAGMRADAAPLQATQSPEVARIMARARDYVVRFLEAFSNVVAEEHYTQDVIGLQRTVSPAATHRELTSDLLLIKVGGPFEWRPFRDVFEVGGKPVRDRNDRLTKLFVRSSPLAFELAARIDAESMRYNLGTVVRTINTPVLLLLFLEPELQPRFEFTLGKKDPDVGENVWVVNYQEQARPTLIRGDRDTDLPAAGRFWIDGETGEVLKADFVAIAGKTTAEITTTFRHDAELGIAVPVEMREQYRPDRGGRVVGTATYGRFRQFTVSASTDVAAPAR